MHQDQRTARPAPVVSVSVPAQAAGEHDLLSAGTEAPAPVSSGRRRLLGATTALGLVALASWQGGAQTGDVAGPDRVEPVSLSLVTTLASAAPVRQQEGATFASLRVRVAVRNDGPSWVMVDDMSLGPYRATGDGLGALAPGALASVPLEQLVACGTAASSPAPRFVEVDVLSGEGPSQVYLGLLEPAKVDPAAILPECTA